jgi:hypothetical protein
MRHAVAAEGRGSALTFSSSFHADSDVPQIMMAMRHHAAQKVQRLYKNIKLYKFSQN